MRIPPLSALASGNRARAHSKSLLVKTFLKDVVTKPIIARRKCWSSGFSTWFHQHCEPTHRQLRNELRAAKTKERTQDTLEDETVDLDVIAPAAFKKVVQRCIVSRETTKKCSNQNKPTADSNKWYAAHQKSFAKSSLTQQRSGFDLQNNAGMALLLRFRIGAVYHKTEIASATQYGKYLCPSHTCPFCPSGHQDTIKHLMLHCETWQDLRKRYLHGLMPRLPTGDRRGKSLMESTKADLTVSYLLGGSNKWDKNLGWSLPPPSPLRENTAGENEEEEDISIGDEPTLSSSASGSTSARSTSDTSEMDDASIVSSLTDTDPPGSTSNHRIREIKRIFVDIPKVLKVPESEDTGKTPCVRVSQFLLEVMRLRAIPTLLRSISAGQGLVHDTTTSERPNG